MTATLAASTNASSDGLFVKLYEVIEDPEAPGYGIETPFRGWVISVSWAEGEAEDVEVNPQAPASVVEFCKNVFYLNLQD
jgi:hypothetical protein